ncbi:hypothetical protein DRW48_14475 [Paracoccus suum]|uniref:Chaperone modulatory protein CbpM n=1 Tax=Paracoccus suum TaxID=2259340 RepID=A0A344PMW8_9RHOB|nr:hypothetical protein [Paracoccus suum]AXC50723.1 hypothetical protein DRW48_14475 [Paracoccus suum]
MTAGHQYSEDEVLVIVTTLTRPRLVAWVESRIVQPVLTAQGPRYREVDVARLQTLCDLDENFGLAPDALGMVMSLMDQVHVMHADLEALMAALAAEPVEVRERVRTVIATRLAHGGAEASPQDVPASNPADNG